MTGPGPWSADRSLDTAQVARALAEALPDLDLGAVRPLGSGWDFDAYEAAGYVFRFPRRATEQARLAKELALLPWLAQQVELPHPRYAWGALHAAAFPYTFAGYAKLEGVHASALDPRTVDLPRLGRALGAQMQTLHAAQPPEPLRATLTEAYEAVTARAARDGKARYIAAFCAHVQPALAQRAARFQDDDTLLVPDVDETPVLLHDDLHVEHLLLDPDDAARVVGWLDWGDACLGDPAREFAALFPWGGDVLLDAMLTGYGRRDADFRARARFHGICLAFVDWHHWQRVGNPAGLAWTTRVLDEVLPP